MLPASPYYPTPQSPAPDHPTGQPQAMEVDPASTRENGGATAAGSSAEGSAAEDKPGQSTQPVKTLARAVAVEKLPDVPRRTHPSDPSPNTTSANPLPTPALDEPPSAMDVSPAPPPPIKAEEEDANAGVKLEDLFADSTPVEAPPQPATALKREEDDSADRKPSLPPPSPFASTSAPISAIDALRSPVASGSGSRSGSGTPMAEVSTEDEEGEDSEDKPLSSRKGKGKAGKGGRKGKNALVESEPQLIGDLPKAEDEAAATYTELPECTYASKKLGDMAYFDEDATRCDCSYDADENLEDTACGDHSNCMNRLMQIECVKGDCRCGRYCQNQRFQKKQYAPIDIVKTEKKGFGVRAGADLAADTFVYEYLGEVIGPGPFARKMKEYANEGIKHFYFMALDKEVFIDATKKGGKGRFLNHSCNPNCVVAKWTVGRKMRMGIFTKRAIKKDEELTFNYNVDRYGHVAQECFCGEPNCVGFIGGKTQTDLGGMDDLYIDALGISEEVEALGLKGSKKKKGRKLDEDFVPTLHPIQLEEVPRVSAAMRQAIQTRRILEKLLQRVNMTTDEEVQRNLLRLHGLNLMNNVLREYPKDNEIIILDLEILSRWKLQTRNKIESSKIEENVVLCVEAEDEKVKALASELLAAWGELKLGYRIPKAELDAADPDRKRPADFSIEQIAKRARLEDLTPSTEESSRPVFVRPTANKLAASDRDDRQRNGGPGGGGSRRLPPGWDVKYDRDADRDFYVNKSTGQRQWEFPRGEAGGHGHGGADTPPARRPASVALSAADLIAQAEAAAKEAAEAAARKVAEEKAEKERERAERHKERKREKEDRERERKEKKVMGLFSGVVVSTMSKYKGQFEADAFKKRAKEVSQILCDKEKKRPSFATDAYDALTPDKEAKVKAFVKDWTKKLLERKGGKPRASTGGASSSSSTSLPATPSLAGAANGAAGSETPATPGPSGLAHASSLSNMDVDPSSPVAQNGGGGGTPSGTPPPRASGMAGAA
ncbi:hypothetical protein JCM6882_008636 [Rhodosporidiobolus microsporus]